MDAIARLATHRAHVLLVEVPGQWRTRATVERAVLARGWGLALSPADADVLAVCGRPRPQLEKAIKLVWHQMPGPRVRLDVADAEAEAERTLDQARAMLLDTEHHRHDADSRPVANDLLPANEGHDHQSMDHGSMGPGGDGGMGMAPSGIALAEGGEDRDGLEMDVLNVRLGPVLRHWPAGLVLRCVLQGDVITDAQAEILDVIAQHHDAGPTAGPTDGPARILDNAVSLLALAGWEDAAGQARRVRDALLDGRERAACTVKLDRLMAKVTRSRVLRWSLRGICPLDREELERQGLPPHLAGDTYDRLLGMLQRAGEESSQAAPFFLVDDLPRLVTGLDLAAARLVVASLDVHGLQPGHVHDKVTHV